MKKKIIWIAAICLAVGTLSIGIGQWQTKALAATNSMVGDLDANSIVDEADLTQFRQHIIGATSLSDEVLVLADVNNDSANADIRDLVRYKRYLMEPDTAWYTEAEAGATEYHITNAAELYGLAEVLGTENAAFEGKTVYVDNDITVNLGEEKQWDASKELLKSWDSIGSSSMSFAGTFDGQNHSISGIYQIEENAESGLFAYASKSSSIQNLRLKNSYFKTSTDDPEHMSAGSVVGNAQGTINNVYSDATVVVAEVDEVVEETIDPIEFTAATTTANGYTMSDTENGLQITGKAWVYATHTLTTPISGADIETVTIRFKVTGGESALMKFYSGSEFFYVDLTGTSKKPENYVSCTTDEEGFTILTLDFQTFQVDAGDTWTSDERSAKNLTSIQLGCNNATGAPTFDYVVFNWTKTKSVEIAKADFTTANTQGGSYTMTDVDGALQITGSSWGAWANYAKHSISVAGSSIKTVTIRYKGSNNYMYFYSDSDRFYVPLPGVREANYISKIVDEEGYTILTLDFQTFSVDSGDTWLPADRATKNLTSIAMLSNNAGATPIFDYVIFTGETFDTDNLIKGSGFGGIVGHADGVNVSQCWFNGSLEGNVSYLGGIAGCMKGDSSITDTMMTGNVTSTKNATQEKFVGGIVGLTKKADTQSITDCMMLGTVNVSWKDSEGADITGARATGSVIGRNSTILNFSDVYTTNDVTNNQAGGTVNITNANVPGCGDLSAEETVSGAPKQRTLADIAQDTDDIISHLGSDKWQKAANNTPILSSFADLKDSKGADPSYLQTRTKGGIYFSNFDDAAVLERAEEIGINPWDNYIGNANATVSHGTVSNGHGSFAGLKVVTTTGYSGVKYNLQDTFELENAKTLGLRFSASGWHNGTVASFVYLTSGDTKVNITDYCNVYNGKDTSGTPTSVTVGQLQGVNYLTICLTVDVEILLEKTELTSFDGIILGHNSTSITHVLDEFYYMPKYTTVSFNSANTTGGSAKKTDTDNGLQISEAGWQRAIYTFTNPISGADISTVTVRFKPATGGAAAIMEFMSGSNLVYVNLNKISDESVISRITDGEFEILTLDFHKLPPGTSTNAWEIADRSTSNLTSIQICINSASQSAIFDYVEFAYAGDVDEVGLPTYETLTNPDEDGLELAVYTGPTDNSVEAYQVVKDAGVRSVYLNMWGSYALNNEHTSTALNSCDTVGLDAYIITNNGHNTANEDLVSFIDTATVDYSTFPAFKGLYAFDEPNISQMDWIKSDMEKWEANDKYKDYTYLVNLMRWDENSDQNVDATKTYLSNYWEKVLQHNDDNILMYDSYPLYTDRNENDVDNETYSETTGTPYVRDFTLPVLETYANFAKEKGSKFYTFLQTYGDKYNDTGKIARNLKSVNDLRFQVAYNMAYGSKGLICYTYEAQAQHGASMIYGNGSKLSNYYYVQEVFNELKDWEHVYMAFDWNGTITKEGTATGEGVQSGHLAQLTQSLALHERISNIETNYDLLVGTFKDTNNNDGFLITSYTDPYYEIENTVKVTFNNASKALVYKNGKLQTNYNKKSCYVLEDGVLEMTLAAGDYLWVIPVQ